MSKTFGRKRKKPESSEEEFPHKLSQGYVLSVSSVNDFLTSCARSAFPMIS
jgi:hypothetical protein